ncbi:hypothetical protein WJX72_004721 [[Myrmecia] bisecta]|uniref:Uncharacterized protein n=1 Tax=[Myrmecia] bisecta TaxID=41462 RepID=A0AAW1QF59_9CHLO
MVHKVTVDVVPNAKPGRESTEFEIFGMAGVPEGMQPGDPLPAEDEAGPAAKAGRTEGPGGPAGMPPPPVLLPPGSLPPAGGPPGGMPHFPPQQQGPPGYAGFPGYARPPPPFGMPGGPPGGPMQRPAFPMMPPPGALGMPGGPRPPFGPPGSMPMPHGLPPPARAPPLFPLGPPAPGSAPPGAAPLFPIASSGPSGQQPGAPSNGNLAEGPSSTASAPTGQLFPIGGAAPANPIAGAPAASSAVPAKLPDSLVTLVWNDPDDMSMEERRAQLPKYSPPPVQPHFQQGLPQAGIPY